METLWVMQREHRLRSYGKVFKISLILKKKDKIQTESVRSEIHDN